MWKIKKKEIEKPKIIKIGEMLNLSEKGETFLEYGIPIGESIDNCTIVAHHQDTTGNIFEIKALLDLKKEELTDFQLKRIYYGPLSKRLKSKITIFFISLAIGIIIKFFFDINIIYYSLGIIAYQILEEIFIKKINKKYKQNKKNFQNDNLRE